MHSIEARLGLSRRMVLGMAVVGGVAGAAEDPGIEMLTRLFQAAEVDAAWFSPFFLSQVPATRLDTIIGQIRARNGAFTGVGRDGDGYVVHFERADVSARLAFDGDGRINMLLFQPGIPRGSVEDQAKAITELPGQTALLVMTNGRVVIDHGADTPLAVGSAFKLVALRALIEACDAGRLAWDRVIRLDAARRSLPSGILQDWPADTPVTVGTLATLMISQSDNTASDAVIGLVGQPALEAISPRNAPFPTTREAFILKADATLRERWRGADADARRGLLAGIVGRDLPTVAAAVATPTPWIEWFLSARELAALLETTHDWPGYAVNPGLAAKAEWRQVAFKGGSEPGVRALATRVSAKDGTAHTVIAIWNDQTEIDPARLDERYRAILHTLASVA